MGTWLSGAYDAAERVYQKSIKSSSKVYQKLIKSSSKVYQFYQKSIKFIRNLIDIQIQFREKRKKLSSGVRSATDNQETINSWEVNKHQHSRYHKVI